MMLDVLLTVGGAGAAGVGPDPSSAVAAELSKYGPVGAFAAVLMVVLVAIYKMNEKARESEGKRLEAQLAQVEKISDSIAETAKAQTATVAALGLVASRLDDLVRDLREVAEKK